MRDQNPMDKRTRYLRKLDGRYRDFTLRSTTRMDSYERSFKIKHVIRYKKWIPLRAAKLFLLCVRKCMRSTNDDERLYMNAAYCCSRHCLSISYNKDRADCLDTREYLIALDALYSRQTIPANLPTNYSISLWLGYLGHRLT